MNSAITRPRSAHTVGDWTAQDASELYEVARWGKGYFSVGGEPGLQQPRGPAAPSTSAAAPAPRGA